MSKIVMEDPGRLSDLAYFDGLDTATAMSRWSKLTVQCFCYVMFVQFYNWVRL